MDTSGKGDGGMNDKNSIDIYMLSCMKEITGEKLLSTTGSSVWHSVRPRGVEWGESKESQEGGYTYIYIYIYTHTHTYIYTHI